MYFQLTGARKQFLIALCVYLGQMIVGYTVGWTAPVIPKLQDPLLSPLSETITDTQMSLVGSLIYVGGLSGPYLTGYLSNIKGRRPCMMLGGIMCAVAYIVLATARTLIMIYIGRLLSGFGIGIVAVMALVYLGEIASTNVRGVYLTGIGIFITAGSVLVFSVGPFVSYAATGYIGASIAVAYTILVLFIPETPIFYALKEQEDAVKKVLEDLGRHDDLDKIVLAKKEFEHEQTNSLRDWRELFSMKGNRRALGICVTLNVLQHCSGIIPVTFFATSIFELAGSSIEPKFATIIVGCTQLFGGFLTPIFIEKSGRRILLLISSCFCCLSMFVLGVYFYLDAKNHSTVQNVTWIPLASLIVFYLSYDSGIGIIPNALSGEMFEPNVRSKGSAIAITASWLVGFVVSTAFGALITVVGGHAAFWFFSGTCAFTCLYTALFVPETKGKSLREIQEMLSK